MQVAALYDIHGNLPALEAVLQDVLRAGVVNAGSVGMPYGKPGSYWLLLGPDVQLRQAAYDLAKAVERIRNTKYPPAQQAARGILQPLSKREILEAFTKVELR